MAMLDCKHDASIETVVSRKDRFERTVEFFDTKLREIAEPAVVDAEYWDLLIADRACSGDHGAVTAKDEHQIDFGREVFVLNLRDRTARLVFDAIAFEVWTTDERDAALRKPHDQLADSLQCLGLMRFKDYAYPLD